MSQLDIHDVDQLREQAEQWRRQKGWTQLEMAQALHIGLQTYGNFKRGHSDLLKATRLRLIDLLNGKVNGGNGAAAPNRPVAPSGQSGPATASASKTDSSGEGTSAAIPGAPTDSEIVQALALAQMRQRPDYIQELGAMAVRLTRLKRLAEEERTKLERMLKDLDRRADGK